MRIDIVFIKEDETEDALRRASLLGYTHLGIIPIARKSPGPTSKGKIIKIEESPAPGHVWKGKTKQIILHQADGKCRLIAQKKKANIVYNLEKFPQKDSYHYRRSYLDEVLAKIMHRANIGCSISLKNIKKRKQ